VGQRLFLVDFDGTICSTDLGNFIIEKATGKPWRDFVTDMGSLEEIAKRQRTKIGHK